MAFSKSGCETICSQQIFFTFAVAAANCCRQQQKMSFTITFNLDCNISIRQTANSHAGISIINSRMASNYKSFRVETIKQKSNLSIFNKIE